NPASLSFLTSSELTGPRASKSTPFNPASVSVEINSWAAGDQRPVFQLRLNLQIQHTSKAGMLTLNRVTKSREKLMATIGPGAWPKRPRVCWNTRTPSGPHLSSTNKRLPSGIPVRTSSSKGIFSPVHGFPFQRPTSSERNLERVCSPTLSSTPPVRRVLSSWMTTSLRSLERWTSTSTASAFCRHARLTAASVFSGASYDAPRCAMSSTLDYFGSHFSQFLVKSSTFSFVTGINALTSLTEAGFFLRWIL